MYNSLMDQWNLFVCVCVCVCMCVCVRACMCLCMHAQLYLHACGCVLACVFTSPEPEVKCSTVAIIIRVILLSPYLRIHGISLSSIHYSQSHRIYINRRQQYIYLI